MAQTTIDRLTRQLANYSQDLRLIISCIVAAPALIGISWIIFPILEARNLGYPVWHVACLLGFIFSGFGIACWTAERLCGHKPLSWVSLLVLFGFGFIAIGLGVFGDLYWAFQRGYFLD